MRHIEILEFTKVGVLVRLANHYNTHSAHGEGIYIKRKGVNKFHFETKKRSFSLIQTYIYIYIYDDH